MIEQKIRNHREFFVPVILKGLLVFVKVILEVLWFAMKMVSMITYFLKKKFSHQINFKLLIFPFQITGRAIVYGIVAHTKRSPHLRLECGNTPSYFTDVYFFHGFINNILNHFTSNSVDEVMEYEYEFEYE